MQGHPGLRCLQGRLHWAGSRHVLPDCEAHQLWWDVHQSQDRRSQLRTLRRAVQWWQSLQAGNLRLRRGADARIGPRSRRGALIAATEYVRQALGHRRRVSLPKIDLIVADPEVLGQGPQPRNRRLRRAGLPIDELLGRHTEGRGQLQLGFPTLLAQLPNRHRHAAPPFRRGADGACRVRDQSCKQRAFSATSSPQVRWKRLPRHAGRHIERRSPDEPGSCARTERGLKGASLPIRTDRSRESMRRLRPQQ
jgi:hypothetical protein